MTVGNAFQLTWSNQKRANPPASDGKGYLFPTGKARIRRSKRGGREEEGKDGRKLFRTYVSSPLDPSNFSEVI